MMLHVDADELYDLSEAGRILRVDPVRIRRWARTGKAPLVPRPQGGTALPRAWVDAETGLSPSDPEALLRFWRERLAPPAPHARRALRDVTQLTTRRLLSVEEASRGLHADAARIRRLDAEGVLPGLRVDGETRYDEALVALVAAGDEAGAEARRQDVADQARFEYVTDLTGGAAPPATQAPPAPAAAVAAAPRAWHLPEDIAAIESAPEEDPAEAESVESEPVTSEPVTGSRLIRTEGFETVDED